MHDDNWTASPALGRRAAVKLVWWGRHGGGAEVSQLGRRELPGEKVIWCPRGMNGCGRGGIGRGVEPCLTDAFV